MANIEVQSTKVLQDSEDVTGRAKFLRVSFGRFGNTKKVDSNSGILTTNADKSMLGVNKKLIDSKELTAIRDHDNALRTWLEKKCVPFPGWPGVMIMPDGLTLEVVERLEQHVELRHGLVAAWIDVYPSKRHDARALLGDEFANSDYPQIDEMRRRFRFDYIIRSFQTPETLKDISPELYTKQKAVAEKQYNSAMEEISAVMRLKLHEMVAHLTDKLTPEVDGKEKQLRQPTIDKINEFLNDFPLRDVSNDTQLAEVVAKAKALLGDTDAATIRTTETFKTKLYAGMEDLTEILGGLVEERPSRKFRLDDE